MHIHLPHHLAFEPADATDDGVLQDIAAEQADPEAIELVDNSGEELEGYWSKVQQDIEKDPTWFRFTEE